MEINRELGVGGPLLIFSDLCLRFLLTAASHKHLIPNDIT